MPIYEFGCSACRRKFEKIVTPGGKTPPSAPCPRCGKRAPRVASRFAVAGATSKSGGGDGWDGDDSDLGGDDGDDGGDGDLGGGEMPGGYGDEGGFDD
jgi:putative FmdB family regulatory protein